MKAIGCYLYTRVSTAMQVDGYSLDAQKDKLRKYADFQGYQIVREYSDAGKSGKNIDGRPGFMQMMKDIENHADDVSYVLVFKLSRFGRNTADILNSLQLMQDYGVNLICVDDNIDSSKESGKLTISVLSAVAEIERENILAQTMEGRKQKAREGKWNGGFAPYGYKIVNGILEIAEEEAGVIRQIFDLYLTTPMGATGIASYLNQQGIKKVRRQNGKLDVFTPAFIVKVLDNPVYCGKIAYGRRSNVKIRGQRNKYHVVNQKEYMINEGKQKPIISPEEWDQVQRKRKKIKGYCRKTHSLDHEHLLSGILVCPKCGKPMCGNVSRKKDKTGKYYQDYFYYACKHRHHFDGHYCDYKGQLSENRVDAVVFDIVSSIVRTPAFVKALEERIAKSSDTKELEARLANIESHLAEVTARKDKLSFEMDSMDIHTPHYDSIYADMKQRQLKFYDEIQSIEKEKEEIEERIRDLKSKKLSAEGAYKFLLCFDKVAARCTDKEKKLFLQSLVEKIEIFPEKRDDRRIVKSITFRFPVMVGKEEIQTLHLSKKSLVETVCSLRLKNVDNP